MTKRNVTPSIEFKKGYEEGYHDALRICWEIYDQRRPNAETLQVFKDTDEGKNLIRYDSIEDFFAKFKLEEDFGEIMKGNEDAKA